MTSYNTGNPIGSKDPRDLYDNAENLDEAVNTRSLESWNDRFGVARKTWWGMEQDFQQFLIDSGYQDIGDYGPGLNITARNQVFWKDGELYRAGAALSLPYTTTGVWASEESLFVAVGDQVLRQQLFDPSDASVGAGMVAFGHGVMYQPDSVGAAITRRVESVSALRLIPGRFDGDAVILTDDSGDGAASGLFVWDSSDLSSEVSQDPFGGVFAAPGSGATGAWRRAYSGPYHADWTGSNLDNMPGFLTGQVILGSGSYTGSQSVVNSQSLSFVSSSPGTKINGIPLSSGRFIGYVEPPLGFPWDPPVRAIEKSEGFEVTVDLSVYDRASRGSDVLVYYVDSKTGSNQAERDGLSPESALRSISTAIARANTAGVGNCVINVTSGFYHREDGWYGSTFNGNLTVLCEDGTYITTAERPSSLSWVSEGGGVYSAVRTLVSKWNGVVDMSSADKYGKPLSYSAAADAAGVTSTPGSYYFDNLDDRVYVHTIDGRVPDGSILVLLVLFNGAQSNGPGSVFVKNATFIGGGGGAFVTGSHPQAVAVFDNCDFSKSSDSNGLTSISTGLTITKDCHAYMNYSDGFNYHDSASNGAKVIEINNKAWRNGSMKPAGEDENSNGSSAHEAITVVRIGVMAWENYGPNIVDIQDVNCWNIGCKAWDSIAVKASQKGDYFFTDSNVTAWLDGCEGGLTGYQLKKNSTSTIYVRNWGGGLVAEGVIDEY